MNRTSAPVVNLGSAHCCACAGICHHIGPIQLCEKHERRQPDGHWPHRCPDCGRWH